MHHARRLTRFRWALLGILVLGGTVVVPFTAAQPGIELEDCRLDRVSVPARCGSLTVHEDRAAGDGRTIDLNIVVIPAVSDNPEPDPLFFLAGGPGQAATELAGPMLPLLVDVRRNRDIVFVDQRGTGGSGRLTCAFFENEVDEEELGESLQVDTLDLDELRECLAEIEAAADPRLYTTPVAMDDLDDVRSSTPLEDGVATCRPLPNRSSRKRPSTGFAHSDTPSFPVPIRPQVRNPSVRPTLTSFFRAS